MERNVYRMLTQCVVCENPKIENRELGLCASCNARQRKFERDSKRLGEKQNKKLAYKIPKISDKLKAELVTYARKKKEHLLKYPDCQIKLIGCQNDRRTNTVHHPSGRGKNLNNEALFMTGCLYCHDQVHSKLSAKTNRELGTKK